MARVRVFPADKTHERASLSQERQMRDWGNAQCGSIIQDCAHDAAPDECAFGRTPPLPFLLARAFRRGLPRRHSRLASDLNPTIGQPGWSRRRLDSPEHG